MREEPQTGGKATSRNLHEHLRQSSPFTFLFFPNCCVKIRAKSRLKKSKKMELYRRVMSFKKEGRRALRGTGCEIWRGEQNYFVSLWQHHHLFLVKRSPSLSRQENKRNTKLISMDTVCERARHP